MPLACNFIPKLPDKSSQDFWGHAAGNHQEDGDGWFSIYTSTVLPRKKVPWQRGVGELDADIMSHSLQIMQETAILGPIMQKSDGIKHLRNHFLWSELPLSYCPQAGEHLLRVLGK